MPGSTLLGGFRSLWGFFKLFGAVVVLWGKPDRVDFSTKKQHFS